MLRKVKKMWCRICEATKPHRFDGVQSFPDREVELWSCKTCGGTSGGRIRVKR